MSQNQMITNSIQIFSVMAAIFGILSVFSFFTGIIPLFTGGMSILFATLSFRKGAPLPKASRIGVFLSVIGIILGVALLVYAYYTVLLPMMNDPEYYNAMDLYYRNNFGVSLEELFGGNLKPNF